MGVIVKDTDGQELLSPSDWAIEITIISPDVRQVLSNIGSNLNSLPAAPAQALTQISNLLNQLGGFDSSISSEPCSVDPPCSGHGTCKSVNYCTCDSGWVLDDCS